MSDSAVRTAYHGSDQPSKERTAAERRWDRARQAVILGWVVILVAVPFAGHGWSVDGSHDGGTVLGVVVPHLLADVAVALTFASFLILVLGPQPWRATRWAWFWWISNPVGAAAFLLLSGPIPGLPAPRNLGKRVTGGWSFLLMVLASSVTFTLWGVTVSLH